MKRALQSCAVLALVLAPVVGFAGAPEDLIKQRLQSSRPDLPVKSVEASEVPGLYAVQFQQGPQVYVTQDGQYFVLGDLFRVEQDGFVNLGELKREKARAALINQVPRDQTIAFSPKGKPKAVVSVFTDVDCPWCQRLHQEVPKLNEMGVEVRYLAYPRAGIDSESYRKIASAWCAKDPQEAMNRLKNRQSIPINVCESNPVASQYELGGRVGVTGTPALITEDGKLVAGYMPADQLAEVLGVTSGD